MLWLNVELLFGHSRYYWWGTARGWHMPGLLVLKLPQLILGTVVFVCADPCSWFSLTLGDIQHFARILFVLYTVAREKPQLVSVALGVRVYHQGVSWKCKFFFPDFFSSRKWRFSANHSTIVHQWQGRLRVGNVIIYLPAGRWISICFFFPSLFRLQGNDYQERIQNRTVEGSGSPSTPLNTPRL